MKLAARLPLLNESNLIGLKGKFKVKLTSYLFIYLVGCYDTQHNDTQHNDTQQMTLGIMTLSIMTLSK